LAHPDLKVIVSQYTTLTNGAIQAIKAAGKTPGKDVKICSQVGGTAQMLKLVKSGEVAVDQYTNDGWAAAAGMQSIIDAAQGKPVPRVIQPGNNGTIVKSDGSWPPPYTQADAGQYTATGE
jgi:ribose transport system substrate-binding protein